MVGAPRQAEETPEIEHEEGLLAETELALVEVAAVLERDRVRLAFDLDERCSASGRRGRATNRVISSVATIRLGLLRGRRVLEEPALNSKGQAVDQRLTTPSSLTLVTIPPGWAATRNLEAIMWNCSPNRFSLGGRVYRRCMKVVLLCKSRHSPSTRPGWRRRQPCDQRG